MRKYAAVTPFLAPLFLASAAMAQTVPETSTSTSDAPANDPANDAAGPTGISGPTNIQTIPASVETPWSGGTMLLDIDASDTQRGIYRITQTLPLAPHTRRVTMMFPKWLPGNHGPRGPMAELVDLRFYADGKPVTWQRDPVEVFAFHVDLPDGAKKLEARFLHTSPLRSNEGRITMTPEMLNLQWEKMSLYPAGHYTRSIRVRPSVTFPAGWTAAAALDGKSVAGDRVTWAETDYETLVDSPIFAGRYYRKWDLGNKVTLNVIADQADLLEAKPQDIETLSALTRESLALFGRAPFARYEFLVALSDKIGGIGLEHLRSSENQLEPKNFVEWAAYDWDRNVLPHELTHAWNGKYRRPARLWTPDYHTPMQDDLLWVYEGQTQFWGLVLAARSGVQSKDMVLAQFATQAGKYAEQPGRKWRSVEDTTFDPVFGARKPKPYASMARDEDYYNEGALIWLEADQIIRSGTGGRRGLDDFAKAFFTQTGDEWRVKTYEISDVVAALNGVYRYDWDRFLRQRFTESGQPAPLAGVEQGGYQLVWKEEPNPYDKARMENAHSLSLLHSLGLTLNGAGDVSGVQWDGPAFKAGVVTGSQIVAVNGLAFDGDRIKTAITAAKGGKTPIELLVKRGERYTTVQVPYYGGLRWPWLERKGSGSGGFDRLLAPKAGSTAR